MTKATRYNLLFVSNAASRSGAPIVLLHLLRWLKQHTTLQFDILLLNAGPLLSEFQNLGDTYLLNEMVNLHSYSNRLKKKVFKVNSDDLLRKVAAKLAKKRYDLVYGNTILSLPWLKLFRQHHNLKTLCCIHELSFALNYCFSADYLIENLHLTDSLIAVSRAVRDNLVKSYQITVEKVALHYEFIDTSYNYDTQPVNRDLMGITIEEFVIGAGGTPEWRKGVDLLIQLALSLKQAYPQFKFKIAWLGADPNDSNIRPILFDLEKTGLTDQVIFIPNSGKPLDIIHNFDVFVSLSREDPFPLIALEAAFLEKPLIAFEDSGGIPELLNDGAGFTVPYLALNKMAAIVYKLSTDPGLLKSTGKKGRELVMSKYNTGKVAPEIYKDIIRLITR